MSISKTFRWVGLLLLTGGALWWAAAGANRGWTKTSVPVDRTDEVTGITVQEYQRRFSPGLDFLGAAAVGGGLLAGLSFAFRKTKNQTKQ